MAFLPERNYVEQTLVSNYPLSSGSSAFTSNDISRYKIISFQLIATSITGINKFVLEQSSDGINWVSLKDNTYEIGSGGGTLIIEKSNFSGKYVRFRFTETDSGSVTIYLISKR